MLLHEHFSGRTQDDQSERNACQQNRIRLRMRIGYSSVFSTIISCCVAHTYLIVRSIFHGDAPLTAKRHALPGPSTIADIFLRPCYSLQQYSKRAIFSLQTHNKWQQSHSGIVVAMQVRPRSQRELCRPKDHAKVILSDSLRATKDRTHMCAGSAKCKYLVSGRQPQLNNLLPR